MTAILGLSLFIAGFVAGSLVMAAMWTASDKLLCVTPDTDNED